MNNFYNEEIPTINLEKLGTVIPAPALATCVTALLCVRLGNTYGISWSAYPIADRLLRKLSADRWSYYFDKVLPRETRILDKLLEGPPRNQWLSLLATTSFDEITIDDKAVKELFDASVAKDQRRTANAAQKLINAYYRRS